MPALSDTACADVLRRVKATYDPANMWGATLDGKRLERFPVSSRYVWQLPDMPYVIKLDYGYDPTQSFHEWMFWHHHVRGHVIEHLFAPTRAIHVAGFDHPTYPYKRDSATERWIRVMTVQDRVMDGAPHAPSPYECTWRSCVNEVGKHFLLHDLDERQCVYDASLEHYVLVDYGMPSLESRAILDARRAVFEEVRMSENTWSRPS